LQKGYELGLQRANIEKPADDLTLAEEINEILNKKGF